jgi:hypothetical protein
LGRADAGELLDQAAGDGRGEQRLTGGNGADPVGKLSGRGVLEQEATPACSPSPSDASSTSSAPVAVSTAAQAISGRESTPPR